MEDLREVKFMNYYFSCDDAGIYFDPELTPSKLGVEQGDLMVVHKGRGGRIELRHLDEKYTLQIDKNPV